MGLAMRVLTAVSVTLLAIALGSPAALAQSDGREGYGPATPTRAKPNPTPRAAPQATAVKPRQPAPATTPRQPTPATTAARTAAVPTDGKSADEKLPNKR